MREPFHVLHDANAERTGLSSFTTSVSLPMFAEAATAAILGL